MKNSFFTFFLLVIVAISFPFSYISAQINKQNPESNEIGYANLTLSENKEYLDTIKILWDRIKKLSSKEKWIYKDLKIAGTKGKDLDDKKYLIVIENKSKWDDGSLVSQMVFYIMKKTRFGYFTPETITFFYDHNENKGIGLFIEKKGYNDQGDPYKDPSVIKERLKKLIHEELKYFF